MPEGNARIIKKTIMLEYKCFDGDVNHSVKLTDFELGSGEYYSDWSYKYVEFDCPLCNKHHEFEI